MNETKNTSGGPAKITRSISPMQWRLAGLALAVVVIVALIAWIKTSAWTRLDQLQDEFAEIKAESYYLGVHVRSRLETLNGLLLRSQLSKDGSSARDAFVGEARELSGFISRTAPRLATAEERRLAGQVEAAFAAYLTNATVLLDHNVRAVRRDSAAVAQQEIERISEPLQRICPELVRAQQVAWKDFLKQSQETCGALQRLVQAAILMHVVFALTLAALIYRALIAPLRRKLSETEALVERQEKLASLGTLATGVAHEIRNPLTAIKFRLFSLKRSLPASFAANDDMQVIGGEINRLERIVREFLQFARPAEPQLVEVPARQILQTVHDLLHAELEKHAIQLKLEPDDALLLSADVQQIEQVLINLVQNAADSIGRDGTITLRVRQGAPRLAGRSTPAVILEVTDTGKGIPADVQKRIFDPFFSTKDGGTGLGLAIAERIVEKHGGLLQFQTQPNRGTTFQVVLPRHQDHASENPAH